MKTIRLREGECLSVEDADSLAGKMLDESSYHLLVAGRDTDVIKPDGTPLILLRHKVLPAAVCRAAYPSLREAARTTNNRGYAAGDIPEDVSQRRGERVRKAAIMTGKRARPLKKDGTVSNTNYAQEVESGIIGHYDRNARYPYCRLTAFNMHQPELFAAALPFIRAVNAVFRRELPERYAAQMEYIRRTSTDFTIHGTAFTTITVNRNWQTAVHKDKGDLPQGFGVMSALRAGRFRGCYLVFPRYRVAVDMRMRDVLLADVHEWHGNTPLVGIQGTFERISTVLYYRRNMVDCGTAAEEKVRADRRKRRSFLDGKDEGIKGS